ncbi:MAG: RDD family protein [Chitinophagaceae bacterium]|nr:RDD family protein [Chitinophagaceae bacterium]
MAPEIKYHTAARRIIAAIIDGLVLLPLGLTGDLFRKGVFHIDIVSYDLWDLLFGFTGIIYSIFFHYYYGRTVGKALVGLKSFGCY